MAVQVGSDRFEINLTPLLDVVLQLIMFFMMCVNFVSEQTNPNVLLPSSSSAQEIQPQAKSDAVILNIEVVRKERLDSRGQIVRNPRTLEPIKDIVIPRKTKIIFHGYDVIEFGDGEVEQAIVKAQKQLVTIAQRRRNEIHAQTKKPLHEIKDLGIPVIVRADADCPYGLVVQLIAQCNKEGFPKVELRALGRR